MQKKKKTLVNIVLCHILHHVYLKQMCVSSEDGAAVEITKSGILPTLAQILRDKKSLSCQVALVVAEMAREGRTLPGECLYLDSGGLS